MPFVCFVSADIGGADDDDDDVSHHLASITTAGAAAAQHLVVYIKLKITSPIIVLGPLVSNAPIYIDCILT